MNQTKVDTLTPARQSQPSQSIFHNYSVDALILQIYFIFTSLAIIISNSTLLWKLFKKRSKTRADKIFIILSCSDIGVGIFSIPIVSIPLFKWEIDAFDYTHCFLWIFPACFPYGFSWLLVVIIALDRVFVITKGQIYKQYITMKTLYWIITVCLALILAMAILVSLRYESFKRHSHIIVYLQLLTELSFIFITLVAYIHLFHFVRSQSSVIATKRHGGADLNKKLTLTVTYTYLCLLLFTLPQVAKQVIVLRWEKRMMGNLRKRMIVNLEYWGNVLSYSNCYANACIILYINHKNHE